MAWPVIRQSGSLWPILGQHYLGAWLERTIKRPCRTHQLVQGSLIVPSLKVKFKNLPYFETISLNRDLITEPLRLPAVWRSYSLI